VASTAHLLRRDDIVLVPIIGLPPIRLGLIWRSACYSARIRALATTPSSRPAAPPHEIARPGRAITG
jgi:hypothetical protein